MGISQRRQNRPSYYLDCVDWYIRVSGEDKEEKWKQWRSCEMKMHDKPLPVQVMVTLNAIRRISWSSSQ